VVAAVASSVQNRAVGTSTAVFGEVGLGGEIRAIMQASLRLREAARMGFERCIVPLANADIPGSERPANCEIVGVRTVDEALQALLQ
jgi:DNA repair protein RadA/Sms